MDLVTVAQDGRLAAFCVGWIWQDKSGETSGQIEPMGVHGDYRHMGLGRAIRGSWLSGSPGDFGLP